MSFQRRLAGFLLHAFYQKYVRLGLAKFLMDKAVIMLSESGRSTRQENDFSSPMQKNNSKSLVLIADDHADSRSMIKMVLEMRGYQVIEAEDGEDAVWMAERNCPNLILMDVTLPHLNGIDAARQIRRFEKLSDVPIVFLTGHAESGFSEAAFAAGAAGYLVKPINLNQLENIVDKNIKQIEEA